MPLSVDEVVFDPRTDTPAGGDGTQWYDDTEQRYKRKRSGSVVKSADSDQLTNTLSYEEKSTNSATYDAKGDFIFRGTDAVYGLTSIKAIVRCDSDSTGQVRVYDVTNSLVICESAVFSNTTKGIVDLGTISALPTGEAVFEVQLKRATGIASKYIYRSAVSLLLGSSMSFQGYKYRLHCATESLLKYVITETEVAPTECPTDAGHTLTADSIALIDRAGDDDPKLEDGKRFVTPDLFPKGDLTVYSDSPDDIALGTRWGGSQFKSSQAVEGDDVHTFQFMEKVHLAGGYINRKNGEIDDTIKYELLAPATAGTSNPGLGAYNKIDTGLGGNIYVPDAEVDGGWDLNLTEKLNANVDFTKAVPVPNAAGTGFFDYDYATDTLILSADQTGAYDLYDFELPLAKHIPLMGLLGTGDRNMILPAVKVKALFPQWKHKVTIHHGPGTHTLEVQWTLVVGRVATV